MQVKLAGFNVDTDILKKLDPSRQEILTPETFSAAYARISRSVKDVTTLRKEACTDVETARKSNKTIIFEMGHHSVAEHAVFNFDIMDVSRLALEEIEKFRLAAYTEKSQRYVTLEGDYVIPKEIQNEKLKQLFKSTIAIQNNFYRKAFEILKNYIFKKFSDLAEKPGHKKILEGWAKEDARYILSLSTQGQAGVTINARILEHLLRRFRMSKRKEIQELGDRIYHIVMPVSPSIFLFPEPSPFEREVYAIAREEFHARKITRNQKPDTGPEIIGYTKNGDDIILASLLSIAENNDYYDSLNAVKKLSYHEKKNIYSAMLSKMQFFDRPPREFEFVDVTFQAVISASHFAQLKRHRIATLVSGDYDIEFGNTIPESINKNNLEMDFLKIIEKTNKAYRKLKEHYGSAADYILTNSHRRLVIMKMNMRELYHFVRLRADEHAQWDIRTLALSLNEQLKKIYPLSSLLLGGKSDLFSNIPEMFIPS